MQNLPEGMRFTFGDTPGELQFHSGALTASHIGTHQIDYSLTILESNQTLTSSFTLIVNPSANSGTTTSTDCSIPGNIPPPLQLAGGTTANVVTETGKYFEIKYENGKEHSGGGYNITWDNQPDNVVVEGYIVGIKIKGTPTTVGTYNYTLTSNAQYNCSTAPVTGTLIVQASTTASLVLSSNQNTLNQSVCNNTDIDPVVFQLGGNATMANVTGLPSGFNSTLDASLNTITLGGSPSVSVATSTTYIYNISNANGSPTRTVTGSIIMKYHISKKSKK